METLYFDTEKKLGKFKPLNATNGGPWHKRHANDQWLTNFEAYKAARIPFARNHDSALHQIYGGPYSHDITCIFPDFNADVNDPASYDFACTDEAIMVCLDAGTETYFRLGQTIEHQIKKHGTLPPADFKKWAEICEHIIMHYTEGWADGHNLNIRYWEIWNEPDLDSDDSPNKRTWGGTKAQFFDMFEIVAKHLKARFPEKKIGGPALAYDLNWADDFLSEMNKRNVPIDFFSWHIYATDPESILHRSEAVKELLIKHGYEKTESILNEWNYIKGWTEEYKYSIQMIHGLKNASFIMSTMALSQPSSIDLLMYYDTRPSIFCGIFDYYSYEPLKGYYPIYWYGGFYDLEAEIRSENSVSGIYSLCGSDKNGKISCMLTYYSDNDNSADKEFCIDFGKHGNYEIYLVDKEHDGELLKTTSDLTFKLPIHSCVLIKEI